MAAGGIDSGIDANDRNVTLPAHVAEHIIGVPGNTESTQATDNVPAAVVSGDLSAVNSLLAAVEQQTTANKSAANGKLDRDSKTFFDDNGSEKWTNHSFFSHSDSFELYGGR
jgi:hypothetical protein